MELKIEIQGMDTLQKQLSLLGTDKIPVFAALALTSIADKVQDGLIQHTRQRLTVRGRWLVKGYKYGINRYRATKHNLEAEVWTQAPWLIAQEDAGSTRPASGKHLAVPLAILRASRIDPRKIPRRLRPSAVKRAFKIETKSGKEIIYRRKGKGARSTIEPLYLLEREVKIPPRLELVNTAQYFIDRNAESMIAYAIDQAIREAGLQRG